MGIINNIFRRRDESAAQMRRYLEESFVTPYAKSYPPTKNPTALAIVHSISSTVMSLGLDLYQYSRNGEQTKAWGHPTARLIARPNIEDGLSQFLYRMTYNYLLYGNVYINVIDNAALYILDSSQIKVTRVGGIKQYTNTLSGKTYSSLSGEIIHIYAPQYYDQTVGHSPIEYNSELFELINMLYLYMDMYFKNSAGERLVFTISSEAYKDVKTDKLKKELERYIQEKINRLNSGQSIDMKEGVKIDKISQSTNAESELASLIDRLKGDIAALFNYPRFYLTGEYGNNLSDQNEMYARACIFPITEAFQEGLNMLLPSKDRPYMGFEFDFSRLVLPNAKELNEMVVSSVRAGVRTKNEGRKLLQLPHYTGDTDEVGDVLAWESNLIPALNKYMDMYFANAQKTLSEPPEQANPVQSNLTLINQ